MTNIYGYTFEIHPMEADPLGIRQVTIVYTSDNPQLELFTIEEEVAKFLTSGDKILFTNKMEGYQR